MCPNQQKKSTCFGSGGLNVTLAVKGAQQAQGHPRYTKIQLDVIVVISDHIVIVLGSKKDP
jgi:hypothetical protein